MLGRRQSKAKGADRSDQAVGAGIPALYLVVLPLALIVSACQAPQTGLGAKASPSSQNLTGNAAQPIPAKTIPLAATPAVAHDAVNLAPVSRLTGDPQELLGLDHTAVRRALGEPNRIRSEDPAQVWQYVTGDCIVDLYLYSQSTGLKVTYVEARSHSAESAPTGRCLKLLLERPTASAE
jgi:hypothetical protein